MLEQRIVRFGIHYYKSINVISEFPTLISTITTVDTHDNEAYPGKILNRISNIIEMYLFLPNHFCYYEPVKDETYKMIEEGRDLRQFDFRYIPNHDSWRICNRFAAS